MKLLFKGKEKYFIDSKDKIKVVCFDLFDTLVYLNRGSHKKVFNNFYFNKRDKKNFLKTIFTNNLVSLRELIGKINLKVSRKIRLPSFILKLIHWKIEGDVKGAKLFPETISVLKRLKKRGFKIALVSNLPRLYVDVFYELGLEKFFDEIIFSFEVGLAKPDKKIFLLLCDRFKVNPENILFIGDSYENDIRIPNKLGFKTLQIVRNGEIHLEDFGKKISSLKKIEKFI